MSDAPQISFVVPCYNYGRYLPDCLAGIFGQQGHDDYEIIAIDDASTDDTAEVLAACPDKRLRVVRHEVNRGHVFTVNEGFGLARGRFVARLDPDDRYRPNFLATLLPHLEDPRVGLAFGDAAIIDAAGHVVQPRCDDAFGGQLHRGDHLGRLLELNYICAPTALGRREAWQAGLPIWEGMAFNDWYLNLMIARQFDLCYVPGVVADYRVHATNHHARITRDRTEEPSVLRVLDHVFAQPEATPEREAAKQRYRHRAYGAQYFTLAEKYFGVGYYADARRCYGRVWRHQPRRMLRPGPLRRWLATFVGPERYESLKGVYHKLAGRRPAEVTP